MISMRKLLWLLAIGLLVFNFQGMGQTPYGIVIHGGAGNGIVEGRFSAEEEEAYEAALTEATEAGYAVLEKGGSAEAAVIAAIKVLEDNPLFNAGKGAVFTAEGKVEHDASLMHGTSKAAGAVASVTTIRHPIEAAQAVMDHSPHVMLTGKGAELFARDQGLQLVENNFFFTEKRYNQFLRAKEKRSEERSYLSEDFKFGTVGAVALDQEGHIVAGTSTGGMTYKLYGRVGDSPIIGAGTYADSKLGGISATGHGEFFIRYAVAYDIVARVNYLQESLTQAAEHVIHKTLVEAGGDGGIVGISPAGEVVMAFNTTGMFRAFRTSSQPLSVGMYGE